MKLTGIHSIYLFVSQLGQSISYESFYLCWLYSLFSKKNPHLLFSYFDFYLMMYYMYSNKFKIIFKNIAITFFDWRIINSFYLLLWFTKFFFSEFREGAWIEVLLFLITNPILSWKMLNRNLFILKKSTII